MELINLLQNKMMNEEMQFRFNFLSLSLQKMPLLFGQYSVYICGILPLKI